MPEAGGHAHGGGAAPAAPSGGMGGMGGMSHGGGGMKSGDKPDKAPSLLDSFETLTGQKPMDPNGFSTFRVMAKGAMCSDCTVLAGKMQIVYENGTAAKIADGVYLHHAITIDLSKKLQGFVTSCPPTGGFGDLFLKQGGANGLSTFIGGAVVSASLWRYDVH